MESALNASWQHYKRTGRALYITPATVMSNEAFEELEDPEQFNDSDLMLPEGLTRERLWKERQQAINGGPYIVDGQDELPRTVNGVSYFPCPTGYPSTVPEYDPDPAKGVNGVKQSSQPLVADPHVALGETRLPINVVNETSPKIIANGETSTSQSSTNTLNGLSSKNQTSPLTDNNLAVGFSFGPLDIGQHELAFDIGEYLIFEHDNDDSGEAENGVELENDENENIYGQRKLA